MAAKMLLDIKSRVDLVHWQALVVQKVPNEEAYLFQKLVRTGFKNNNVDHCTRMCHASSVAALMETIGSGLCNSSVSEVKNLDVAIIIGARPTQNHPVAATFIKNAVKEKGLKLIVMDPRSQDLSRITAKVYQFKPGTDVALLNGMINTIIEEGLADRQYIEKNTEGYLELVEHIKEFTPEEMSKVCGIPPNEIRETARIFANLFKSAMIFWGMGISQHIHGTDNSRCLISLLDNHWKCWERRNWSTPIEGQNNVQGASDVGLIPMVLPDCLQYLTQKMLSF